MKNTLIYWLLLSLTFITACSGGGEEMDDLTPKPNPSPSQPTITLETSSISDFATEGGNNTISFKTSAAWTAEVINSRAESWCSVSPTSGGAGNAEITVVTTPNDTPDDRSASIVIKAGSTQKTINVSQKQKDALTVTASKFEVTAEGGEVKIEVKANINFEYEIDPSAKEWINYQDTRALKTSTLVFSVAQNEGTKKREGKINIKSGEFNEIVTIYQAGTKPDIIISKDEYIVSSNSETIGVEVASNVDVDIEIPANVDWIIENTTRALSTNTYYFDILPNEDYDQRTAEIKFTNKANGLSETIKVVQMQKDAIVLAKRNYTVDNKGEKIQIEVGHNVDFDVHISVDWITKIESRSFTTETLTFNIAENKANGSREGTITFISKDGTITQAATIYQTEKDALIISKNDIVVSDKSGTISFEIQTNVEFKVSEPNVDWIREITTRGLTTHTLRYEYDANESYDSRRGEIVVTDVKNNKSEKIIITQAQKDAIVLAKSSYDVGIEGSNLDFEIQTNVDITVTISSNAQSWIQRVESRGLVTKALYFNILPCQTNEDREGTITISGGNATQQVIKVRQSRKNEIIEKERATLIEFYQALNGDNWKTKNNWCSDRPLNEWSDVRVNEDGFVVELSFNYNNMQGAIPKCIGQLAHLKKLDMYGCGIVGPLPDELADCKHLQTIELGNNPLTGAVIPEYWGEHMQALEYLGIYNTELGGELPRSIGGMKSMKKLFLASNKISGTIPESIGQLPVIEELLLSGNNLTGSIPESMANLPKLKDLTLHSNNFQGSIPKVFQETDNWKNFWPDILDNNEFDISNVRFYGPSFKDIKTLDGKTISDDIYSKNKLTILCTWLEWAGTEYLDALKEMYAKYKDMGLEIICYSKEKDINVIKDFMQKNSIEWTTFSVEENKDKFLLKNTYYPFANIIAPNGEIINTSVFSTIEYQFPKDLFIELEYDKYESTDYSKDGEVKKLQTATKGNGIDIILMGDAFSDRQIADGTYDRVMSTAMEKFFIEEPYKSFRDHFNVYSVTCVSKHDIYGEKYGTKYRKYSESALDTSFGLGTEVGGNDDKVFNYVDKTGINNLLSSSIIVIMNSTEYAGTCYMLEPFPGETSDWGPGLSISYFPIGEDDEALRQVINHEAGGHGFAKLADEYAYKDYGAIPSEEVEKRKTTLKYGWWKNVDFTDNPTQVKWYHFLRDDRYDRDGLGVYEGGFTYWTGVWRPTENSIMRHNTGGFNAPSREAIYYRIHKLAYGADWQYDYEKFVEYDAINRKASARSVKYVEVPRDFKPLHAPVIKRYNGKYGR